MPPDSQSFQPRSDPDVMVVDDYINVPSSPADDAMDVGNNMGHKGATNSDSDQPSTSTNKNNSVKMLKFNVQYCDRIITVELPETSTVCKCTYVDDFSKRNDIFLPADLRIKLFNELKISPCRQILSGWARMSQYGNTPFSALQLPQENALHLTVKPSEGGFTSYDEYVLDSVLFYLTRCIFQFTAQKCRKS